MHKQHKNAVPAPVGHLQATEALRVSVEGLQISTSLWGPCILISFALLSFVFYLNLYSTLNATFLICRFLIHPVGTQRRGWCARQTGNARNGESSLSKFKHFLFCSFFTRTCKHINCHVLSLIFSTLFSSLTFMDYCFN